MSTFSIHRFGITHKGPEYILTAEMSDLGHEPFRQIYPDACDPGLTVVGKQDTVDFVVDRTVTDKEGELKYYELIPTKASIRRVPTARSVRITLFND